MQFTQQDALKAIQTAAKEVSTVFDSLKGDELPDPQMKVEDAIPESLCRFEAFMMIEDALGIELNDSVVETLLKASLIDAAKTIHALQPEHAVL